LSENDFNNVLFSECLFFAQQIDKEKHDASKITMQAAAFNAYLMGAGGRNSYNAFMKHLGLSDESTKMTKAQKKILVKRADDVVKKISKMRLKRKRK
jgi:hypothetical protein